MMSVEEICREYRLAKNKKEQIGILADLNCTTKEEIIKVLVDCGEEKPPRKRKEKQAMPEEVAAILCSRMDELDVQIKPLEKQLNLLKEEYKAIAGFLKNFGQAAVN